MTSEKTLFISIEESNLYKTLLKTQADVLYQQFGYKRDECFIHTCHFGNGIDVDLKLVLCEEGYPYTEGVLFKDGQQISFTEPFDFIEGKWEFTCDDSKYTVVVKAVENPEIQSIFGIIETALEEHCYKIVDGDMNSVLIRECDKELDFEIKISEIEG